MVQPVIRKPAWQWLASFCALALGGAGLALLVRWDAARQQYPGAVRQAGPGVEWPGPTHRALTRAAIYQTDAALGEVISWYQGRLRLSPARGLYVANGCAFMGRSRALAWLEHAVTVLVCATPGGTRVVVTHRLALRP